MVTTFLFPRAQNNTERTESLFIPVRNYPNVPRLPLVPAAAQNNKTHFPIVKDGMEEVRGQVVPKDPGIQQSSRVGEDNN